MFFDIDADPRSHQGTIGGAIASNSAHVGPGDPFRQAVATLCAPRGRLQAVRDTSKTTARERYRPWAIPHSAHGLPALPYRSKPQMNCAPRASHQRYADKAVLSGIRRRAEACGSRYRRRPFIRFRDDVEFRCGGGSPNSPKLHL